MRRITDDLGETVVVEIHDINFASSYSDRIVAMKEGRILHHGTPIDLMTPAALWSIYELDVRVETIGAHPIGIYFT